jgi:hypothetical protein
MEETMNVRWSRSAAFTALAVTAGLTASAMLGGCTPPAPPSPQVQQLEHQYQMGCRPEDAQGYERQLMYCSKGDGGGGGRM